MKVKVSKAPGPDGIPNWILHDLAGIISGPVCAIYMYNTAIREGNLPSMWKSANVTPLAKVKNPSDIKTDIRPISLTAIISKSLESSMGHRILIEIGKKLDPHQFGGIKGSSTTHALTDLMHLWHKTVHACQSVNIIFLDFYKAFDLIDHTTLIQKFAKLGLSDVPLRWLWFLEWQKTANKTGK